MFQPTLQDVEEYWQRGYWISPKLLDDDRIARLRRAVDRLFAGERDGHGWYFEEKLNVPQDSSALRRVINAWWVNDEIRAMVFDPMIGEIAAKLMKVDRVRLWADQVLSKPGATDATNKGNIGWHQDAAYWHIASGRHNMITAWIALQDTDLTNGGMRTLVGSHKWGLIEDSDKFYDPNLDGQRDYFMSRVKGEWIDEPCVLKAGQISFHHSLCFHGSETNRTSEPRLSVVGHYMSDGTSFEPSGRPQVFLRLLGPSPRVGTVFTDPYWPLVWPRECH